MSILLANPRQMFTVFDLDGRFYMTLTVGGVAQYEVTITLSSEEVAAFGTDPTRATALAIDVATRTSAYERRQVRPAIDPA